MNKFVYILCLSIFIIGTMTGLHGFSIPAWHSKLGGEPKEVLFSEYRDTRTDDWALDLAIVLGQLKSPEPFSSVNPNIGSGQSVLIPFRVPAHHWVTLFRPATWGFFVGADFGLSWLWWFLVLGNFLAMYLAMGELLEIKETDRLLFSLIYLWSPFLQFWSFHTAEIYVTSLLALFATIKLFKATSPRWKLIWGLFLVWSMSSAILGYMYPPRILPVFIVVGAATLGFVLHNKDQLSSLKASTAIVAACGAFGGLIVALFLWQQREVVQAIQSTVYPGQRLSLGGSYPIGNVLTNWLLPAWFQNLPNIFPNLCEASGFFYTFPVSLAAVGYLALKKQRSPIAITLAVAILFLLSYAVIGFPKWLATITLMGKAADNRVQIGLGLADLFLLAYLFSKNRIQEITAKVRMGILLIMTLCFVGTASRISLTGVNLLYVLLPVICFSVLLFTKLQKQFLVFLLAISLYSTFSWNPVAKGGTQFLYENPFSQELLKIDQALQKKSSWLFIGDPYSANLPRILGIKSWTGFFLYPDKDFWKILDPRGTESQTHNMSAYVYADFTTDPSASVQAPFPGRVHILIPPNKDLLSRLGVTHLAISGSENIQLALEKTKGKYLYQDNFFTIIAASDLNP